MPDYANPAANILIFGETGTCKTSLAFSFLLNVAAACRFIFDDRGQAAARLKLRPCGTARECELAVPTRWVCFNPHVMFPGARLPEAFRWFCHWSFEVCKRGAGEKVILLDELWQWSDSRHPVPPELENIIRTGRCEHLQLLTVTHNPREYHELVRSQATEFIAFKTESPLQLESIRPYWPGVDAAANLPKGKFLAYNRESRANLSGMMDPGWPPGRFNRLPSA